MLVQNRRSGRIKSRNGKKRTPRKPVDSVRDFLFGSAPDEITEINEAPVLGGLDPAGGIDPGVIPVNGRPVSKRPLQIRLSEKMPDEEPLPANALTEVRRALTAWADSRSAGVVKDFGRGVRINRAVIFNSYIIVLKLLREKRSTRENVRKKKRTNRP